MDNNLRFINGWYNQCWRFIYRLAYTFGLTITNLRRIKTHGACVVIQWNRKILIINNSYQTGWGFPGGLIKRGEESLCTIVRETLEEVGIMLQSDALTPAGICLSSNQLRVTEVFELHLNREPEIVVDQREIISAQFVSIDEALALPLLDYARNFLEDQ